MSDNNEVSDSAEATVGRGWRLWLVLILLLLVAVGITARMLSLYVEDQAFLQTQGDERTLRTVQVPAHRGIITDRNGEPLAVSAPVATIWADPKMMDLQHAGIAKLAALLKSNKKKLIAKLSAHRTKRFLYLQRQGTPELAEKVRALRIPGVHVDREYKRYYPAAEVTTHLVGFTNLDGKGQEGLELAYEDWLKAESGKQLVMKDRLGRTIKHVREVKSAQHGNNIELSIDLRLQYLAYRELKTAVKAHNADGGSLVMLDVKTGEVLAMVNQPSYNPNDPRQRVSTALRNRSLTDTFEPGSTVKPMTVAAALMSGQYTPDTLVDTSPGYFRVKRKTIRDHRNYGEIDVSTIITKSSNVGVTKLTLSLPEGSVRNLFHNVGLGQATGIGFPGESSGYLPYLNQRQVVERATLSYGYGLSVTPLQLAQSYLALANDGVMSPVNLIRQKEAGKPVRVMPASVAKDVRVMMETVISNKGTGRRAAVPGYRVAGKTGTVHKVGPGGYIDDQYMSTFAGIAPVSNPRLVTVVMIDNPKGQEYYGGEVAAPVFSRAVGGALRLLNVPPDNWPEVNKQIAHRH
ncbi:MULTISPECIES: penicillin-binding protein 2 [unclassified Neptuniibacter]|jgi:cell division protein FtsI (penicillin-binding protein 3)|uniref:peptidoglycan D,D-transpeptidase FtsI family protein n=1 Tax=unclassified Neptuniibacter TaxID=2630693 RepID=UPI0026E15726|nr:MULTISPECIES: penicillin-binding transpeptidase domain-containing protein [unclassified Neptuniibacter]MDO6512850.1 penicillin-binding transpeptidase domain-containing protein [Neptuniibacter sp. 2_MG-2023]MDO6592966.1 penicillin-binding transpeptidase domain-containing protein [Neptuniibacter sp. 1_MG-2023]